MIRVCRLHWLGLHPAPELDEDRESETADDERRGDREDDERVVGEPAQAVE